MERYKKNKTDERNITTTKRSKVMTTYELIKLLDNTFPDVEFDIFTDTEGLVRVNFCVDENEEE